MKKLKEEDLTEFVRRDLEELGYETYGEVSWKGGSSRRCDMFAKNGNESIVFEAKLSFNLTVIEQAYKWKANANKVYVLIPKTHRKVKSRIFARTLCQKLGIGVMEVNLYNGNYSITVKPEINNKPKLPKLYTEQKLTKASNAQNEYVTPFKMTVKRLNEYMENKDSEILLNVIKNIDHHYKNEKSACGALKKMIERRVIPDYSIIKVKNKLTIVKNNF